MEFMKKISYFLLCLIVGAALSMTFTGCGDENPSVNSGPETPEEPEKPGEPTTVRISSISYFYSSDKVLCYGDTADYIAHVEKMIKVKQDSVANAKGSLVIELDSKEHNVIFYDQTNDDSSSKVAGNFERELVNSSRQQLNFVYTGGVHSEYYSATISDEGGLGNFGTSSGTKTYKVYFPNIASTKWATDVEGAEVKNISFGKSLSSNGCTINDNQDVVYKVSHDGYRITLTLENSEIYVFDFNEDGTQFRLMYTEGLDVIEDYIYTKVTE